VWASRAADIARALPSVFRTDVPTAVSSAAAWLAAVACAWLLARAAERRFRLSRGVAATVTAASLVFAVSAATFASWRLEAATGSAPVGGQLRLLNRVARGGASRGVLLDPLAVVSPANTADALRFTGSEPRRPAWAWFWLTGVPAGRYRVSFDLREGGAPFDVDIVLGRGDAAAETWQFDAAARGRVSRDLDLVRAVRSVALRGTPEARARILSTTVEPVAVTVPAPEGRIMASRRYGRITVMAVGETLHLEGPGAWAAALVPVEALIRAPRDRASQRVRLRAGPVATVVQLRTGGWNERISLAPGEERDVDLPLAEGTATLSVHTNTGFRPADVDPASTDTRHLGVWLEFR
jgi:hypothetical protein